MSIAKSLFLCSVVLALLTSISWARDILAKSEVNGKPVLIFDDGFWRYDDEVGEVCTPTGHYGSVCALPSVWSRLPEVEEIRYGRPEFVQGEYLGEFFVLQHWGNGSIKVSDVSKFIKSQTTYGGLEGIVVLRKKGKIATFEGEHIVISHQSGISAFTYVHQNGRYLIAQTRDQKAALYFNDHRKAHKSFVDAIEIKPFDKQ